MSISVFGALFSASSGCTRVTSKRDAELLVNELFTALAVPQRFHSDFLRISKMLKESPQYFEPDQVTRIIQAKNMFINLQRDAIFRNGSVTTPLGFTSEFESALENYLKIGTNSTIANCLADIYLSKGLYQEAIDLLERHRSKEPIALSRFALIALGSEKPENREKGVKALIELAESGDKWAKGRLALAYHQGLIPCENSGEKAREKIHEAFDEAVRNPYREVEGLQAHKFTLDGYDLKTKFAMLTAAKNAWDYYIDTLHSEKKFDAVAHAIDDQKSANIRPLGVNIYRSFIYASAKEQKEGSSLKEGLIAAGEKIEEQYVEARSCYYRDRIRLECREDGPLDSLDHKKFWENDPDANYYVAVAYYFGRAESGLTRDENMQRAKEFWEKAKNLGCERASQALAALEDGSLWGDVEERREIALEEMNSLYSLPLDERESEELAAAAKEEYEYGKKEWHERVLFWIEKGTAAAHSFFNKHRSALITAASSLATIALVGALLAVCTATLILAPYVGIPLSLFVAMPIIFVVGYQSLFGEIPIELPFYFQ